MNILIVKLAALGDVLRTTSLLRPLRERYPDAEIRWLTSESARPLLEGNPLLSEIRAFRPPASAADSRTPESPDAWVGRFDLVLSMEEDPNASRLARRACRGELIGVYPDGERLRYTTSSASYYDMSLLNRDPDGGLGAADALKAANTLSYAELWLGILRLPIPNDRGALRPILALNARDREAAARLARDLGLTPGSPVGLNLGAGGRWPAKQLSEARASSLIEALREKLRRPLLLLGGPQEGARNRRILQRLNGRVMDAGTGHDLRGFAAVVELCGAVLTTDTLALHVATALGRPVAILIGPTSAAELDACGTGAKLRAAEGCSCFYRPACRLDVSCLDRIPDADILGAIENCLAAGRSAGG